MSATAARATATTSSGSVAAPGADAQERRALVEVAGEIARREIMPASARLDRSDREAMAACWQTICEVGLDRALVSQEAGGAGIGERGLLSAVEELALGDGGTALAVLLSNVALAALPSQRAAAVPAGARWAAVPVGWGARVAFAADRLAEVCVHALGAHGADGLVFLFAAGAGGVGDRARGSMLCMQSSAPGLRLSREEHQLGLGGAPVANVSFTAASDRAAPHARPATGSGCQPDGGLNAERRSGPQGQPPGGRGGSPDAEAVGGGGIDGPCPLRLIRLGAAAVARGIARRAEEVAREYAHARRQGGVAIVEHDAVRDMLGAMALRRLSLPSVHERPEADLDEQAIATKIALADAAVASTIDAVQVLGGIGYMRQTGVEKLMRDAKCIALFPEPGWVAQDMLDPAAGWRRVGAPATRRTVVPTEFELDASGHNLAYARQGAGSMDP